MGNRQDRLTKYGIVALAGIAVLGWVREPEKHHSAAHSAQARTTFYPSAAEHAVVAGTKEFAADNLGSVHANHIAREPDSPVGSVATVIGRMKHSPVEGERRISDVVKLPEHPSANTGRHEDPHTIEDDAVIRSREPRKERSEDSQVSEQPQDARAPMPRADRNDDTRAHTQSPTVGKKERSTARSAAIIVGTAAAGAAIGAAAGGGKG